MKTYVSYRDIPKDERRRLAAEAYRKSGVRIVLFAAVFFPILLSGFLAEFIAPRSGPFWPNFGARLVFALILCAMIWGTFGRRRFKAEVEKLKNSL